MNKREFLARSSAGKGECERAADSAEQNVRVIRGATKQHFTAEDSIAELCRSEGINQTAASSCARAMAGRSTATGSRGPQNRLKIHLQPTESASPQIPSRILTFYSAGNLQLTKRKAAAEELVDVAARPLMFAVRTIRGNKLGASKFCPKVRPSPGLFSPLVASSRGPIREQRKSARALARTAL